MAEASAAKSQSSDVRAGQLPISEIGQVPYSTDILAFAGLPPSISFQLSGTRGLLVGGPRLKRKKPKGNEVEGRHRSDQTP